MRETRFRELELTTRTPSNYSTRSGTMPLTTLGSGQTDCWEIALRDSSSCSIGIRALQGKGRPNSGLDGASLNVSSHLH